MKENRPKIVLGIIRNEDKKVLMVLRKQEEKGTGKSKLLWSFPGGKIRKGETIERAVEREILEETGYGVTAGNIISERPHPEFPVYIYSVECFLKEKQQIRKPQAEEIEKIEWVKLEKIREYLTVDFNPEVATYLGL